MVVEEEQFMTSTTKKKCPEKAQRPWRMTIVGALILTTGLYFISGGTHNSVTPELNAYELKAANLSDNKTLASDNLLLLWTSGDREVATRMVFMYAKNSRLKGWWTRVKLVVWGPSAQLLANDQEIQKGLEELKTVGVEVQAYRACADSYGVTDRLKSLGVEVIYMGEPLTQMLKKGWTCLTL